MLLSHCRNFKFLNTCEIKLFFWLRIPPPPSRGPQRVRGSAPGASDFACPSVPDIPVQQPEQRDSSPPLRNPEHVATTEPMCSTAIRPTDCGALATEKDVMTSSLDCVLWDVRN